MYLLLFCCDHLYFHITIPLIEYPHKFEKKGANIKRALARVPGYKTSLRRVVNANKWIRTGIADSLVQTCSGLQRFLRYVGN